MTTNRNTKNVVRSSSLPPFVYNIQYPNCGTGMFSLRPPLKNFYTNERQEQIHTRSLTRNGMQPKHLLVDQNYQQERVFFNPPVQRDAQVQCSLINSDNHDKIPIRRTVSYNYEDRSHGYRVPVKLPPKSYEVWDVETPPSHPRSIPINEPIRLQERSIVVRSPRLVKTKSLNANESNYNDQIVYTRYPRRTYVPANVRTIRTRQDANTISY